MLKQVCKTIDSNLEAETWGARVGPLIGGHVPTAYGSIYSNGSRTFSIVGGPYSDWLASCHRPLPSNTGKLSLAFELNTDARTPINAQALEFDTRVSASKLNYNFSSQFNYQKKMFQISKEGHWTDTGIVITPFTPNVWVPVQLDYIFDIVSHKYSTLAVTVAGIKSLLPSSLQNLTPTNLGWTDGCSMQVQQDLNAHGGAYEMSLRNIEYAWS